MAKRDVELVIRAEDRATRTVESVSEALKVLSSSQQAAATGAKGAAALLAKLESQLERLGAQATALKGLGQVSKDLQLASAAMAAIEGEAAEAAAAQAKLAAQSEKLGAASRGLEANLAKLQARFDRQDSAAAGASAAQTKAAAAALAAQTEYDKLERKLGRLKKPTDEQREALSRLGALLRSTNSEAARAAKAADPLIRAREKTRATLTAETAALKENAAEQRRLAPTLARAAATSTELGAALARSREAFAGLQRQSTVLNTALGTTGQSLDEIGQKALDTARDIQRLTETEKQLAAIARTEKAGSIGVQRREYLLALRDVQRLKTELANAKGPSDELNVALLLARERATRAGEAYTVLATKLRAASQAQRQAAALVSSTKAAPAVVQATAIPVVAPSASKNTAQARIELDRLIRSLFRGVDGAEALNLSLRRVGDGSRTTLDLMQRLRGQILAVTAASVGFFNIINQLGNVVDTFRVAEASANRLSVVFKQDFERTGREVRFLTNEADRLGIQFGVLADEYSKFAVASDAAGFSNEAIRRIFISTAEAGRVNKLSSEQMGRVFLALTQIISKQKLQAEELTQQLGESLPGATVIMAEAMGFGADRVDLLFKAMEGGLQVTEQLMVSFADTLDRRFGAQLPAALENSTTQLDRLSNSIFQSRLLFANSGFISELTVSVKALNVALASEEGQEALRQMGAAVGALVGVLPEVIDNFGLFVGLIQSFIAIKIARGILNLVTNLRAVGPGSLAAARTVIALRSAFDVMTSSATAAGRAIGRTGAALVAFDRAAFLAVRGIRAFIAGLGGIPGILIAVAIGAFIDAFVFAESAVDKANAALGRSDGVLLKVRDAFAEAATEAEALANAAQKVSAIELRTSLRQAQAARQEIVSAGSSASLSRRTGGPFDRQQFQQARIELNRLYDELVEGSLAAEEFKAKIIEVLSTDGFAEESVRGLLEFADKVIAAEQTTIELEAALAIIEGTATEAQRALIPLGDTAKGLFQGPRKDADAFAEALDELRGKIPRLAGDLQRLKDLAEIKLFEEQGLANATNRFEALRVRGAAAEARQVVLEAEDKARLDKIAQSTGLSASALEQLIAEERIELTAYQNGRDEVTIGIGHTAAAGGIQPVLGMRITRDEAFDQFGDDLKGFAAQVDQLVTVPITDAMRAALTSIQFNSGGLNASDGRRLILDPLNAGDYETALRGIQEFRTNPRGFDLSGRREREAALFDSQGLPTTAIGLEEIKKQQDRETAQTRFNERIAEENLRREESLRLIGREEDRELAAQKAVLDARAQARTAGVEITPIQEAGIAARAAEVFGAEAAAERAEAEKEYRLNIERTLEARRKEIELIGIADERERARAKASADFIADAIASDRAVDPALLAETERLALATFDAEATAESREAQQQFTESLREGRQEREFELAIFQETAREQQILRAQQDEINRARADGLAITQEELDAIRQLEGALFDQANVETQINELVERRQLLQEQIEFARDNFDTTAEFELNLVLDSVNAQLEEALTSTIAFYEALGGEGSANAVLRLQNIQNELQAAGAEARITRTDIENAFANTATSSLTQFAEEVASGENAIKSLGRAFQQFAADFLGQIAQMLIQLAALRIAQSIVGSLTGGGGILAGILHAGGVAGRAGSTRRVSAAAFAGAQRFHSGGLPGLRRNEVPAILERGEEVLTRSDPRNVLNGGASGGGPVKIVNAFDSASFLEQSLSSRQGEQAILNFVRANSGAVKAAMGG